MTLEIPDRNSITGAKVQVSDEIPAAIDGRRVQAPRVPVALGASGKEAGRPGRLPAESLRDVDAGIKLVLAL